MNLNTCLGFLWPKFWHFYLNRMLNNCHINYSTMHLKHLSYWTKITIICCFCTCQKGPYNYNDPEFVVPIIQPTGTENYLSNPSDYIFDQNSLHTFELKLPGSALHAIDSNPTAEQYVEGMLIFEGDTLSPVGIRNALGVDSSPNQQHTRCR